MLRVHRVHSVHGQGVLSLAQRFPVSHACVPGFKETTQSVIEVPDMHHEVFVALLGHLYTGKSPMLGASGDDAADFGFAVELLKVHSNDRHPLIWTSI